MTFEGPVLLDKSHARVAAALLASPGEGRANSCLHTVQFLQVSLYPMVNATSVYN